MNTQLLLKILAAFGVTLTGAGGAAGMASNGVDWWNIAIIVSGYFMAWLVASRFGTYYQRAKAVIDQVDKALDDDAISYDEIKAIIKAFRGK